MVGGYWKLAFFTTKVEAKNGTFCDPETVNHSKYDLIQMRIHN